MPSSRTRLACILALSLAGCNGEPGLLLGPSPHSPLARDARVARLRPRLRDYQGVMHCHSLYSHDSKGTQEEIIAAAARADIDFILMTDHPSEFSLSKGLKGWHGRTYFLVGAEVEHWLGIDMRRPCQGHSTAEALRDLQEQDALAFVAHPESFPAYELPGYQGMEIYNIHADLMDENVVKLAAKLPRLLADPSWVLPLILTPPTANLRKWDDLNQKRRVVGIAGNDSHQNVVLFGQKLDKYEISFGFVNTHLLASRLDRESIRDALVRGHVYVSFEVFGKARGFTCTVDNGDELVTMGDEVALRPGTVLEAHAPRSGFFRLVKDGRIILRTEGDSLTCDLAEPGVYRVEMRIAARGKVWPWIYGNPIYVR
ncbi:MAG: hypothetical protein HYZ53_00665 [Planctomycetes bacterium]|nr:hypothetical protein [Planctomycetota bacterium]